MVKAAILECGSCSSFGLDLKRFGHGLSSIHSAWLGLLSVGVLGRQDPRPSKEPVLNRLRTVLSIDVASSSKHHAIVTEQSSTKPSLVSSIGESFW
jgi:hypothetical protein